MTKPSPAESILAGLDEVLGHLEKHPMKGKPFEPPDIPLTPDQLDWSGELLYGPNWKAQMALVQGWESAHTVNAMLRGIKPIPPDLGYRILNQLRSRAEGCIELVQEIEGR